MIWARLVFLLLLSLELGGCWERSTRLGPAPTAASGQYGFSSPIGDDLPTPRFFQIERYGGATE